MSLQQLPLDIIRVIAIHLSNIRDIYNLTEVCRYTHRALSADEFWRSRCERDFDILSSDVKTVCRRYQLLIRLYYQKYSQTHRIDKLMRSWIVEKSSPELSSEEMMRFYLAFVRFFREKLSYHTTPLTRQQRKHWRHQRRKGHSRPNDIWICGPSSSGKTLFSLLMARVTDGLTRISWTPECTLCEETSNRLYISRSRPSDNFAGEIFEFRNNFTIKYHMDLHRDPLEGISRAELKEYISILETYGGEFYPTSTKK